MLCSFYYVRLVKTLPEKHKLQTARRGRSHAHWSVIRHLMPNPPQNNTSSTSPTCWSPNRGCCPVTGVRWCRTHAVPLHLPRPLTRKPVPLFLTTWPAQTQLDGRLRDWGHRCDNRVSALSNSTALTTRPSTEKRHGVSVNRNERTNERVVTRTDQMKPPVSGSVQSGSEKL
jgi:hypothetical protein